MGNMWGHSFGCRVLALLCLLCVLLTGCGGGKTESSTVSSESSSPVSSESQSSSASEEPESSSSSFVPWGDIPVHRPEDAVDDPELPQKLQEAIRKNPDVIGWLQIPGTGIDYPVLQTKDNEYYLDHNALGEYSKNGAVYAHYRAALSNPFSLPANATLFGHNTLMSSDPMFMELLDFYDAEHARQHPYLTFTFPDGTTTYWKIFAALDTLAEDPDFYYYNPSPSLPQHGQIIREARERSYYDYETEAEEGESILSLSTCTYKFRNWMGFARTDVRFVLAARLVREGELLGKTAVFTENLDRTEPYPD